MIICIIYFMFYEFAACFRDFNGYITDPFNLVDWLEFIANGYILWYLVRDDEDQDLNELVGAASDADLEA